MARRRRYTNSIVLSVLVLVASGLAYWSLRRVPDSVRDERQGKLLPSLRRDQIARIEFVSGNDRFQVFKQNGHWILANGTHSYTADDTEVERLLTEAEIATPSRRLGPLDAAARERFGLDHPRAQITLREERSVAQTFSIGGVVSSEENAYIEIDHSGYVVPKSLADAFVRRANELRDRALSEIDPTRLTRLEIDGEGGPRVLTQTASIWNLTTPANGRVSRTKIDSIMHDLRDMRATRYLVDEADPSALARYGLSTPRLTLRAVRGGSGAPIEWRFGGVCENYADEVVIMRMDTAAVACVGRAVFENVNQSVTELADNKLVWAHPDEIERVRIHNGAQDFSIVRDHDHWRVEGSSEAIDADAVDAWLTTLGTYAAEVHLEPATAATHALASPTRWIEITRTGVAGSERLDIGDPDADRMYVRREGEQSVLGVDPSSTENLRIDAARFRSRQIIRDVADQMNAIVTDSVEFRDDAVMTDGAWRMNQPANAFGDPTILHAVAQRIASLDADRWVALEPAPIHGLASSRVRITARFEGLGPDPDGDAGTARDGGRPHIREYILSIGANASGGGVYASLGGKPGVFVLPQAAYDELAQPHIDRNILEVDRANVDRIEITRPGSNGAPEHIVVQRDGEVWRTSAGAPVDRTRVTAFLDHLSLVRAPRVFGYGQPPSDSHLGETVLAITTRASRLDAGVGTAQTIRISIGSGFGSGSDAGHYAQRAGIDAVLSVPNEFADAIRTF